MSVKDNLSQSPSSHRKTNKRQKSVKGARVLPDKVIDKKIQRNSSSFIFNAHSNNAVSAKSKSKASKALMTIDENMSSDRSDSEEDITIDYLLVGNEKNEKGRPSKKFAAKQEFKISHVPNQSRNVKEKSSEKSEILNKNLKVKNNRKEKLPLKTRPIENYFNVSSQGKSLQDSPEICGRRTVLANSQKKKFVDGSISQSNVTSVCNNASSISAKTKSSSNVSRNKPVAITPQQRSNASLSNDEHLTSRNAITHSSVSVPRKMKHKRNEILDTSEWEGPRRSSGRLRNKKVSSDSTSNIDKKKKKSSASSPSHIPQAASSSSKPMDNKSHRKNQPSKPIKKPQPKKHYKNKRNVLSQILDDSIMESTSCSQKLHSTAINVNTQALTFDDSSIEPIEVSSTMPDQDIQPQHDIVDVPHRTELSDLAEPSSSNNGEQDQQLMEYDSSLPDIPRVPDDITRHILRHYSDIPISNSAISVLNVCCDDFWRQTLDTLHAYAQHAQRQMLAVPDIELLLRRQGYAYDRNSLNSLIEQHLPVELVSEIIAESVAEIL